MKLHHETAALVLVLFAGIAVLELDAIRRSVKPAAYTLMLQPGAAGSYTTPGGTNYGTTNAVGPSTTATSVTTCCGPAPCTCPMFPPQ